MLEGIFTNKSPLHNTRHQLTIEIRGRLYNVEVVENLNVSKAVSNVRFIFFKQNKHNSEFYGKSTAETFRTWSFELPAESFHAMKDARETNLSDFLREAHQVLEKHLELILASFGNSSDMSSSEYDSENDHKNQTRHV